MKRVIILGGGYGGMRIVRRLLEAGIPDDYEVILVDRLAYHSLKTEFYALAAGTISDANARLPFPKGNGLRVVYTEVMHIDLDEKCIITREAGELEYDVLVIALGCEDHYHGIPGADQFTNSIQTLTKTRRTFQAINNVDPGGHIRIVGGGLSGVEMAAELRESRSDLNITIYDRNDTILNTFPDDVREYVGDWFVRNDVHIEGNATIRSVGKGILDNNGQTVSADAIIWTAGVQPSAVVRRLEVEKNHAGRIVLNEYYRIPGYENVYVVGDCADLPYPPSAQLAQQQGLQVGNMIARYMHERSFRAPSAIRFKGALGTLGKSEGFGWIYNRSLTGTVPRLLKSGTLWAHKFRKR